MTFNGKELNGKELPRTRPQPEWSHRERNAGGRPTTNQVNDWAPTNDEEKRLTLFTEILTLSPPPPGCEQRARLILRKFTLNELQVLAKALRDASPTT